MDVWIEKVLRGRIGEQGAMIQIVCWTCIQCDESRISYLSVYQFRNCVLINNIVSFILLR